MKVKELVEKLLELDQEIEIYFSDAEYGEVEVTDVTAYYKGKTFFKKTGVTEDRYLQENRDNEFSTETIVNPIPVKYIID